MLAIVKSTDRKWIATFSSLDQSPDLGRARVDSIALQGANLKSEIAALRGSYAGTLSSDGAAVEGTWSQGRALPLELR